MEYYISTNLKYLRQRDKISQQKLASLCGKRNTAVANWEKGIREPNAIDLIIICRLFDVTIDDFIKKDFRKEKT